MQCACTDQRRSQRGKVRHRYRHANEHILQSIDIDQRGGTDCIIDRSAAVSSGACSPICLTLGGEARPTIEILNRYVSILWLLGQQWMEVKI